MSETPLVDELEKGPWPSFVKEIKKTAENMEKLASQGKDVKLPKTARNLLQRQEDTLETWRNRFSGWLWWGSYRQIL
ncbi:MAG: hypothetical protein QXM15_04545 [Archaeoglobaceae archaeon]